MKYDIFISYRRDNGAQYARILQLMLQQRGYKVFLDYDELTDGVFGNHIKEAIKGTSIFMLILSENALQRCENENDWLRQELLLAIREKKHIIPINPDGKFSYPLTELHNVKNIPTEILEVANDYQHSEIRFGQALGITVDFMIKHRIAPIVGERIAIHDNDITDIQRTPNTRNKHRLLILAILALLALFAIVAAWIWRSDTTAATYKDITPIDQTTKRDELHAKYRNFNLYLDPNLSNLQIDMIDEILFNMSEVKSGVLWISQYEFTIGQWYGVQNIAYDKNKGHLPMVNVSYGEVYMLLCQLCDMTNLNISLPSVEEWQYAAKGGPYNESSLYVGNDNPNAVAWYKDNSGGVAHPSDGQQGLEPNFLDLYDMSGNVSELCNSTFKDEPTYRTICGGHFNSPLTDITVTSCAPFHVDAKDNTVGFRIVIHGDSK